MADDLETILQRLDERLTIAEGRLLGFGELMKVLLRSEAIPSSIVKHHIQGMREILDPEKEKWHAPTAAYVELARDLMNELLSAGDDGSQQLHAADEWFYPESVVFLGGTHDIDPEGVAQTEADQFGNCATTEASIDMRDLAEILAHAHDAESEIGEEPEPPVRKGPIH
jgi:hypothetical protein